VQGSGSEYERGGVSPRPPPAYGRAGDREWVCRSKLEKEAMTNKDR